MSALRETPMDALTLSRAYEMVREATKDKSYQLLSLGPEAAAYLRAKRKRLTTASYRDWESALDKLVRHFPVLRIEDFEPPRGREMVEEFLDAVWGECQPRTYNKNLTIVRDFFRWQILAGHLHGDPTLGIDRARTRDVDRTIFTPDQAHAIIACAESRRDRLALRLLLNYGLRQGALRAIQFKHFDYVRRRLTIFTKGGRVRSLPIPHPAFWTDLERHVLDAEARPHHFLMATATGNQWARRENPERPMSNRAAHYWWYERLAEAGIVPTGTTSGEKMHKARHTAGQRLLDGTGNLKAVQKLLGHASIQTTADVYTDWDEQQLASSLAQIIGEDE